jgi:hypothetical protein
MERSGLARMDQDGTGAGRPLDRLVVVEPVRLGWHAVYAAAGVEGCGWQCQRMGPATSKDAAGSVDRRRRHSIAEEDGVGRDAGRYGS